MLWWYWLLAALAVLILILIFALCFGPNVAGDLVGAIVEGIADAL